MATKKENKKVFYTVLSIATVVVLWMVTSSLLSIKYPTGLGENFNPEIPKEYKPYRNVGILNKNVGDSLINHLQGYLYYEGLKVFKDSADNCITAVIHRGKCIDLVRMNKESADSCIEKTETLLRCQKHPGGPVKLSMGQKILGRVFFLTSDPMKLDFIFEKDDSVKAEKFLRIKYKSIY